MLTLSGRRRGDDMVKRATPQCHNCLAVDTRYWRGVVPAGTASRLRIRCDMKSGYVIRVTNLNS